MDTVEAIEGRRSVRAFKSDPVSKSILEKIMSAATKAPSWENTQPWEFAVLSPTTMDELRAVVDKKRKAGDKPNLDIPWPKFTGIYHERTRSLGKSLLPAVGLKKEDMADWWVSMTRFFGAPNGVIAYMDSSLGEWSVFDMGLAMENLMVAAWHYGVGTCALSAGVIYPDLLHDLLKISESKKIILALAVGYPDLENPKATFRADRDEMKNLVTWHGFE